MKTSSRSTAREILGGISHAAWKRIALAIASLLVAAAAAWLPQHEGLTADGTRALFLLVFCAGLWITEAVPAFAVGLLAMGLAIVLLGGAGGEEDWQKFVAPWGSPLVWLFFSGFILAEAAKKTGLDRWMVAFALGRLGTRPAIVLLGMMSATALLSMFLSNTATAAMMVAMLLPMLHGESTSPRFAKAMLLGVAMAANVGGMGTLIGTPPNAIAAGVIGNSAINFAEWMVFGVPPAVLLLALAWVYLTRMIGPGALAPNDSLRLEPQHAAVNRPRLPQLIVVATFSITLALWLTSPLHGVPTTVVSFIPICALTLTGTLDGNDVKNIAWDVLLLIAGGLSLGVAVSDSGLADWIVVQLPVEGLAPVVIAIAFAYLATLLSNVMSNTAAANVILPLAMTMLGADQAHLVVPIALAASAAMCLPVSTPPNAIVYGTGKLATSDLLAAGLLLGIAAPLIAVGWAWVVGSAGWVVVAN